MGKQFKSFPPVNSSSSEDLAMEELVEADTQIHPTGDLSSLSRLPAGKAQSGEQDLFADPAQLQTLRLAVPEQRPAGQQGKTSSAKKTESSASPLAASPKQKPQTKQKKKSSVGNIIALSCLLGMLILVFSGYWIYQARANNVALATPIAAPTQVTYTVVTAASTPAGTPTATPTPLPTVGPGSPMLIPTATPTPSPASGQRIVVSVSKQSLTAYQDGKVVLTSLVTTGMPELYTPQGTYHIIGRVADAMFTSPWPKSSPYYYAPLHVNYGLQLTTSGIYLHDATWRSQFGPGTDVPHNDPVYGQMTGSHGCVELPLDAMAKLYKWTLNGIVVEVVA